MIFRFLQSKQRIVIWMYENTELRIEGRLIVRARRAAHFAARTAPLLLPRLCSPRGAHPSAVLQGFDEYMNLVLDEAEEIHVKKKTRKSVGRIMLKGDAITLMQAAKAQ